MTLKQLKEMQKDRCSVVEVYVNCDYSGGPGFHQDFVRHPAGNEYTGSAVVSEWEIMDEKKYNERFPAGTPLSADFKLRHGDKNATVLCVKLKQYASGGVMTEYTARDIAEYILNMPYVLREGDEYCVCWNTDTGLYYGRTGIVASASAGYVREADGILCGMSDAVIGMHADGSYSPEKTEKFYVLKQSLMELLETYLLPVSNNRVYKISRMFGVPVEHHTTEEWMCIIQSAAYDIFTDMARKESPYDRDFLDICETLAGRVNEIMASA